MKPLALAMGRSHEPGPAISGFSASLGSQPIVLLSIIGIAPKFEQHLSIRNVKRHKLLSDVRLPRYTWGEDYRSFPMYVNKVLKDYERRAKKSQGGKQSYDSSDPSLRAVA